MASQTEDAAPAVDSSAQDVPEKNNHEHNLEHHDNNSNNHHESPLKPTGVFSNPSLLACVSNKRSHG